MERAQVDAFEAVLRECLRETGVAEAHGGTMFLRDPHWSAAQQVRFHKIVREAEVSAAHEAASAADEVGASAAETRLRLAIPTGGSSGGLKFAVHEAQTLGAAVRGFCAHFGVARVNAVDVLPPWHVSGLMARLRCAATGGVHVPWEWKRLEAGELPERRDDAERVRGAGAWFLSLVPTQLQRLLSGRGSRRGAACVEWLRGFDGVFVGGGPLWPSLADEAAAARLPIILSYGMTETAAMVAAQRVGDFARGDRSSGGPMPHAQVSINDAGLVCVRGESVMRSYLGGAEQGSFFTTADLGRIDEAGCLHVLGRRDEVAISGGEKVRLGEVEAALREGLLGGVAAGARACAAGIVCEDVVVVAVPDAEWGEAVVACYLCAEAGGISEAQINVVTRDLARHQRPKQWLRFAPAEWPRNAQGKLNRAALREAVLGRIHPGR